MRRTPASNRSKTRRLLVVLGLLAAGLALATGCADLGYYTHSLVGGAKVLAARQPIDRLIADPATDSELRDRLTEARTIRDFAVAELGLPDNKSYRTYSDIGRDHVSWTVTAAPEFSTSPITWCFPIAGCVSYRGYFSEEKAERFAARLAEREGYDVDWGGVSAYSTLGWFADPILSTFLDRSTTDLAGLIFHELAHQVVYVKNGTDFNESFATAVELEGVRRWLASRGESGAATSYRVRKVRQDELTDLLLDYRRRLAELYATDLPDDAMRSEKETLFRGLDAALVRLRDRWQAPGALAGWIGQDLNNAHLASVGAYHGWVPAFEALLAEAPSLTEFYAEVARLAELEAEERSRSLDSLTKSRLALRRLRKPLHRRDGGQQGDEP